MVKPQLAIANSKYTQTSLEKFYKVPTTVVLCPIYPPLITGIENREREQTRQNLNTNPEKIVIIQVSRLERWKGQSLLLSALAQLKELDWECWIVGGVQRPQEEVYLQELRSQAQSLGIINQVKFLGQRSDVPNLLAAADIHCQPNLGAEPFGITFIEALYAGLPVVTTNMGGGAEIVNSSCGVLVEPDNPSELANTLRSLIINSAQRQELGSHGHTRAKQLCDPAQQINQLYNCLSAKISETSGR